MRGLVGVVGCVRTQIDRPQPRPGRSGILLLCCDGAQGAAARRPADAILLASSRHALFHS